MAKASNTTNLFSHLKSHHSVKYSEVTQAVAARTPSSSKQKSPSEVQPTLVDMVEKSKQYQKNGKKWQALTDSVTKCICKDMMPIFIQWRRKDFEICCIHLTCCTLSLGENIFQRQLYQLYLQVWEKKSSKSWRLLIYQWFVVECNKWAIHVLHYPLHRWDVASSKPLSTSTIPTTRSQCW